MNKIHWLRIIITGILAEAVIIVFYIPSFYLVQYKVLIMLLDFCIVMFIAGLVVSRKIGSRFLLHGMLVGIAANLIYLPMLLPLLFFFFPEELTKSAANEGPILMRLSYPIVKILSSAVGAYVGGRRKLKTGRLG